MVMNEPKDKYNRSLIFTGENCAYWKDCMYVHLMYVDLQIWVAFEDGPFIP